MWGRGPSLNRAFPLWADTCVGPSSLRDLSLGVSFSNNHVLGTVDGVQAFQNCEKGAAKAGLRLCPPPFGSLVCKGVRLAQRTSTPSQGPMLGAPGPPQQREASNAPNRTA